MGKPGDACCSSELTHTRVKEEEEEGEEDGKESCGLCLLFTQRCVGSADRERWRETETDNHTQTDGDLETEGEKVTDAQTNKLREQGRGEDVRGSPGMLVDGNNQKKEKRLDSIIAIVIPLALLWVLWTTVLADFLQTQVLAWEAARETRADAVGVFSPLLESAP